MGHSKAQKAKTHKRIVAIASKRFREGGLAGIGIAELMKEAGLTVGASYKHFKSPLPLLSQPLRPARGLANRRFHPPFPLPPPTTYPSLDDHHSPNPHPYQS